MEEYINSFIEEARELLSQMESDLLKLESNPGDKETINNVFRVMHTLKGAAHMYGFDNIQELTHEFETIYQNIRDGKQNITTDIIDETLQGKDILLKMLDKKDVKGEAHKLVDLLFEKYLKENEGTSLPEKESEIKKSNLSGIYCLLFTPDEGIFGRGLDPERLLEEIKTLGVCNILVHEGDTPWADQKAEKVCHSCWEIYLQTENTFDDIEGHFLFYDSEEFAIIPVREGNKVEDSVYDDFFKQHYGKSLSKEKHISEHIKGFETKEVIQDVIDSDEEIGIQEKSGSEQSKKDHHATINVSSSKLDELMNLVSELVTSTASLEAHAERFNDLELNNAIESIEKLTKKFRSNALDLRLIPVGTLLNRFNRHVRDLSKQLNKSVKLIIDGQDTEIDKTILKSIENPLLHIIRNSIDHGIEPAEERLKKGKTAEGLLKITAFYSGPNVVIQVHDDGRGIDFEKVKKQAVRQGLLQPNQAVTHQDLLNIIMEPGFSTTDTVSMVSGRGVGMDVVRKELGSISGSMEIDTEPGLGTSITMKLPTTLSIIDTLMIEVNRSYILIPLLEIEYCFKEKRSKLFEKDNNYIKYKNELVPYLSLREKFQYPNQEKNDEMIVVINKYDKKYALIVDKIVGEHQAVIKPLGGLFVNQPYFSGGSIMVDGSLALILDTNHLFLN